MRKKWNSTRSTLNLKLSSCRESLDKYLSLCSCNTSSSVYKNVSYRGHRATLCDDIVTNPWPPIHSTDPTVSVKAPRDQVDIMYFGEDAGKQCVAMSLSVLIYTKIKGIHSCPGIAV